MKPSKIVLLLSMLVMLCLMTGLAAADDTWKPENYTTLKPVPQDRIILGLPEGMVADCSYDPVRHVLTYTINTKETDWASVLAYTYRAESGQAYIRPGIKMPEGADSQRTLKYSVDPSSPEGRLLDKFLKDEQAGRNLQRSDARQSQWIGSYNEENAMFMPEDFRGFLWAIAAKWYDEDTGESHYEYLHFTITYTDANAFTAHMPKVPNTDIIPNVCIEDTGYAAVTSASKGSGSVRYQVGERTNANIYTAVSVPKIDGVDTSAWTCYMRTQNSASPSACMMAEAGQYGLASRSALIAHTLNSNDAITQNTYTLEWRNSQGTTQYISQLSSVVVLGDPAPWPTYAGWTPVPPNRMTMSYLNPIESGTKMTYDAETGIAYFHITPEQLPETSDYAAAQMNLTIAAPEGASAYALAIGNGEREFGDKPTIEGYIQNQFDNGKRYAVSEGLTIKQPLFKTHRKENENLTLYSNAMMPGEFAAEYTIINWYRNISDKEPMLTEYIFRQMDDCLRQHVSTPYGSEDELPQMLTAPVVVIPNEGVSSKEMQFIAEIYPIESENSRYYELRLVDANGKAAHLPANAKIIMRYPEGISADDFNIVFNLRHLNNKHQTIETFSAEEGNLHLEEDYLWFTPSSLSPFILEWSYADDPTQMDPSANTNLPDTGDNSWPLVPLTMLCAISSVLFVQLNRRKA